MAQNLTDNDHARLGEIVADYASASRLDTGKLRVTLDLEMDDSQAMFELLNVLEKRGNVFRDPR